jgi:hypothetical protein
MNINITTATVRYDFKNKGVLDQLRYSQLATTTLLNSKVPVMSTTGHHAAAKMAVMPMTL